MSEGWEGALRFNSEQIVKHQMGTSDMLREHTKSDKHIIDKAALDHVMMHYFLYQHQCETYKRDVIEYRKTIKQLRWNIVIILVSWLVTMSLEMYKVLS